MLKNHRVNAPRLWGGLFFSAQPPMSAATMAELCELTQSRIAAAKAAGLLPVRPRPSGTWRATARPASPPLPALAPRGSCAAETDRLPSHQPVPGRARRDLAADLVTRHGFGVVHLTQPIAYRGGITGGFLAADLDAARTAGARAVLVVIDSPGGLTSEMFGMVRALRRFSDSAGPVVAWVRGLANSAAGPVAAAADFVVGDADAEWFFHHTSGGTEEDRAVTERSMQAHLAQRSFLSPYEVADLQANERALNVGEAIAFGLVDEVGDRDRAELVALAAAQGEGLPGSARQAWLAERARR